MTDDHSPVELSWEWGVYDGGPNIHCSFEPIGRFASTQLDPLNQFAALRFVQEQCYRNPKLDLTWFEHFKSLLSFETDEASQRQAYQSEGHQSRIFLGYDILGEGVTFKAYFMPAFKALSEGISKRSLIEQTIGSLPGYCEEKFQAFKILENFLDSTEIGSKLTPEIVAIDCVAPSDSRIKIYVRDRSTSFVHVRRIMTLSECEDPGMEQMLQKLKSLWALVLGLEADFDEAAELPGKNHRTAGILYYFEIRPGRSRPTTKVYIPVRHYGENDLDIARGVVAFRSTQGQYSHQNEYLEALNIVS